VRRRHGVSRSTTRDVLTWLDLSAQAGYGGPTQATDASHDWSRESAALFARVDAEAVAGSTARRWMRWTRGSAGRAATARVGRSGARNTRAGFALAALLTMRPVQPVPVQSAPVLDS